MSKKEKAERMEKTAHAIFDITIKSGLTYQDFAVVIGFVVGSLPFSKKVCLKRFLGLVTEAANHRAAMSAKEAK